jgi:hypothetical protein
LLAEMHRSESPRLAIELFRRRLTLDEQGSAALLERLSVNELVRLSPAHVAANDRRRSSRRLPDNSRSFGKVGSRAAVFGDSLTQFIKRAPELMAKVYRADAAVGVREVLAAFDGRQVPTSMLDYREFRDKLKGLVDAEAYEKATELDSKTPPSAHFLYDRGVGFLRTAGKSCRSRARRDRSWIRST